MPGFGITGSGKQLRPSPDRIMVCKFRNMVECDIMDYRAGMCKTCGWNPLVEAARKKKMEEQ